MGGNRTLSKFHPSANSDLLQIHSDNLNRTGNSHRNVDDDFN